MIHRLAIPKRRREEGQTIILVAICIVSLLAVAALAIDVVTFYVARSEVQRAADALAIAGAQAIADSGVTTLASTDGNLPTAEATAQTMMVARVTALLPANTVAGVAPTLVTSPPAIDWTRQGNPILTIQLQRTALPTFFAKIWGHTATTVSATAVAEVYNSSNTTSYTPIAPSAVKPWLIANLDPKNPPNVLITLATGEPEPGIVGKRFNLTPKFPIGAPSVTLLGSELQYVPAVVTPDSGKNICPSVCEGPSDYERSIECADVNTTYSCGVGTVQVDNFNPAADTLAGGECLIHAATTGMNQGQDSLNNILPFPNGPPQILSGSNPKFAGQYVSTSNSIVTIPIIDQTQWNPNTATIVGYLQAFINQVQPGTGLPPNSLGDIDITVLNVSGCAGASNGNTAVVGGSGTSPVPVRLISAP